MLYIEYIYTLQIPMPTSGRVIHHENEVSIPLTPSKYTVLNGNFVFDLRDVFQELNPGVKGDLPIQGNMGKIRQETQVCACTKIGRN
jgi:hypothetical protein